MAPYTDDVPNTQETLPPRLGLHSVDVSADSDAVVRLEALTDSLLSDDDAGRLPTAWPAQKGFWDLFSLPLNHFFRPRSSC